MKKLAFIFAVSISNIIFSQYYEDIKERSNYIPDSLFKPKTYLQNLFLNKQTINDLKFQQPQLRIANVGIISLNSLEDANFLVFFENFDFLQFTDTIRYKVDYQLENVLKGSTFDLNDPSFHFQTIGYIENISIFDRIQNKPVYIIRFNYLDYSNIISEAVVYESSAIAY
jgi:hypothetical protein